MKLYKRDGRRFVPVTDLTGWYLNKDYTLSETRTEKSIAICVLHTISKMVFCELNDNPPLLNWYDAKEYCSIKFLGNGRLPEIHELLTAKNYFSNIFPECGFMWSNTEYDSYRTRALRLNGGTVYGNLKSTSGFVFAFLTIDL